MSAGAPVLVSRCACGTELAPGLLSCPSCQRLVHAGQLKALAALAESAITRGVPSEALGHWRTALELLPPESRQHAVITERLTALSAQVDAAGGGPIKKPGVSWASLAGLGAVLTFVLTKAKLLLVGLAKLPTLLTMFAAVGVYWTLWGWRFAVGLVLQIYVHEMGHVAALRSAGIAASAPMFIPGLGAFVRLNQRLASPREDARIGLAGPWWGLFAAAVCLVISLATDSKLFAALAQFGVFVNAFNLTPLGSLDGGRGFAPLNRWQRVVIALLCAGGGALTGDGLWYLVAIAGAYRAWERNLAPEGDRRTLISFALLVVLLSALGFGARHGVHGVHGMLAPEDAVSRR